MVGQMTDLERAQAHMEHEQEELAWARKYETEENALHYFENGFLAALSWVWEEQEKVSYGHGPMMSYIDWLKVSAAVNEEIRRIPREIEDTD